MTIILYVLYIGEPGGQQGWIYSIYGIMSTIPSCCYKDPPKIIIKGKQNDEERKCCGAVNS